MIKDEEARRTYNREYHRRVRSKNPVEVEKSRIKSLIKARQSKEMRDGYLKQNPCACGESDISCLDFHHIEGKKGGDIYPTRATNRKRFEKEISKCVVLCANCHRKLHARENNIT